MSGILHDGEGYGQGLAEATKAKLGRRSVTEANYDQITPGQGRLRAAHLVRLAAGRLRAGDGSK